MKPNFRVARLLALGLLAAASFAAQAQNYSFNCITGNNAADCATGEAQFALAVTDAGSVVNFYFTNTGSNASSLTDIYFDWASGSNALPQGTITSSAGVSFSWGASPGDLPGGNPISFDSNLGTDSNPPRQPNGVNPGEWLNIAFNTQNDAIGALNTGGLLIGIHTQGYQGGGSESLVTTPIPEPETYAMLLAGLGLLGFEARRRRKLQHTAA